MWVSWPSDSEALRRKQSTREIYRNLLDFMCFKRKNIVVLLLGVLPIMMIRLLSRECFLSCARALSYLHALSTLFARSLTHANLIELPLI